MKLQYIKPVAGLLLSTTLLSTNAFAEWSGNISLQERYFINEPLAINSSQENNYLSIAAEVEYYTELENQSSVTITPFLRFDQHDENRTHGDIRELSYQQVVNDWELTLGISKVYWGVTESQHLVDVINQTDTVENIDGEDKLGQPMFKASTEQEWGTIDIFVLPYFREQTFQDSEGRPRTSPRVETDLTTYESSDEEKNIDYALRWFNYLGDIELGISYFNGTSREATFALANINGTPVLAPHYPQMQQYGLDIQLTTEEWLWKLELISRDWQTYVNNTLGDESFIALTGGFEYTFVGIFETDADLGLVSEYLYDDRDEAATSFFQNDTLVALRLAMNDEDSTEVLFGLIRDLDNDEYLLNLEASKRYGDSWKATLEIRGFNNIDNTSLVSNIAEDDFIQLDMAYYF